MFVPRLYMYNGFGIFTYILERLLNCAVDASCGECIMCEVAYGSETHLREYAFT